MTSKKREQFVEIVPKLFAQIFLSFGRVVLWGGSERTKGAEKASCKETVVQKGIFGESVFFFVPLRFALKTLEALRIN